MLPDPSKPYALLRREGRDHVEILTGPIETVATLADIPLDTEVLALVPYRQMRERGFDCVDDGTPLRVLRVEHRREVPLDDLLAALPDTPITVTGGAFDVPDEEYADIVGAVLRDEIGRGEGANFVIHRVFEADFAGDPRTVFKRLLRQERGAYWTFIVHDGLSTLVGATPERHVSVEDGIVMMNPISGTYRHPEDRDGLLRFLDDRKEIDELSMVLDEELKMMATVADLGGQVIGPYLKEMAHLAHTEYLLAGRGSRDVREVLRETMFAPTVTGSPIENACRVVARHERRGRGYYGGVLALIDRGRRWTRRSSSAPRTWTPPVGCACRSARRWCGTRRPRARSPRRTPRPPGCWRLWVYGREPARSATARRRTRRMPRCRPPCAGATRRWPRSGWRRGTGRPTSSRL